MPAVAAAEDLACLVVVPSGNVPVTAHGGAAGIDGRLPIVDSGAPVDGTIGETNSVEMGGRGLSPAPSISVDPKGMLARPACSVDRVGIDELPSPVPMAPVPAQALDATPTMPSPSNRGVAAGDVGPPAVEQLIVGGAGLVPGAIISVAPSGMPVGATDKRDPMARGDVVLSGEVPIPLTCARVDPQPRSAAANVVITNCIFMASTFSNA
jgi:hypothetical protein